MLNYIWLLLLVVNAVFSQTTDKYSDEDRPYKFGFNIQGYQHRQEEKDEKGLIKGEYGFITADGYYRVTVYATDENGDFRIISMKNYYVGFPPEDPTTTPEPPSRRSGGARPPQSSPSFPGQAGPTGRALAGDVGSSKPAKPADRSQVSGLTACSDCFIPTTTTRTSQADAIQDFRSGRKEGGGFGDPGQGPTGGRAPTGGQVSQFPQGSPRSNTQGPTGRQLSQGSPGPSTQGPRGQFSPFSQGSPRPNQGGPEGQQFPQRFGGPQSGVSGLSKGREDFQDNQLNDSPRRRPNVGEVRDGLPPGVSVNDIKDLLYTFNYTVGFHGHHEDGFRNGDKEGDYFFDGRDGVERKVEYLANEFGYQPNITLIDLPENDVRRPKEETEKEYGLKGYEFKWFYRK